MSYLERFSLLFSTNARQAADDVSRLDRSLDDAERGARDADRSFQELAEQFRGLSAMDQNALARTMEISQGDLAQIRAYNRTIRDGGNELDALRGAARRAAEETENLDRSVGRGSDSFTSMTKGIAGLVGAYISLDTVVGGFLNNVEQITETGRFAERMGEDVSMIDAFQKASVAAGGDAEMFREDMLRLNDQINDFAVTGGGEGVDVFEKFGIASHDANGKLRKSTDIFMELTKKMKGMSNTEISAWGEMLGFDAGTVALMQAGEHKMMGMLNQQMEYGVITKESYEESKKFHDQLNRLKGIFGALATEGTTTALPFITSLLSSIGDFVDFVSDNSSVITDFIVGIGTAIAVFLLPKIITLTAALVSAAAASLAAAAPFILMGIAIAAVGVAFTAAYRDVQAFFDGQDSLIGRAINRFPVLGKVILAVMESIKGTLAFISSAFDFVISKISVVGDMASSVMDWIPDWLGGDEAKDGTKAAFETFDSISANPLNTQSPQNTSNKSSSNSVKIDKIEIKTQATDTDGIAREVAGSLESSIRGAQMQFDDGVLG